MRTRFRGITVREGVLIEGDGRLGRVEPVPRVHARGRRAVAALRRGGGGRRLAGAGARPGAGQRDRPRGRPGGGPRDRRATAAAGPPRSRSPSPGRRSPTTRPGSRRCATRSGPTARIRVDANGALGRRRRGRGDRAARPGGRGPGVRRAAVPDGRGPGRRTPAGRRPDRGRRVDPPGRGPLPGARPRGRRHRGAQGAAARRGAGLPADRRGHRAAGRRVVGAGDLVGIAAGVALAAALPELPYACGLATGQLLTADVVDRAAGAGGRRAAGRRADGRPAPLDRLRPRPTGWRVGGAAGRRCGPCGRIGRS